MNVNKKSIFYNDVVKVIKSIPSGKVLTYAQVAELSGHKKAYRAVGNILKNNFDDSIACHRVLPSSYRLGDYNRGRWAKLVKLSQEGYRQHSIPRYYQLDNIDNILEEIKRGHLGLMFMKEAYIITTNSSAKAIKKWHKIKKLYSNIISEEHITLKDVISLENNLNKYWQCIIKESETLIIHKVLGKNMALEDIFNTFGDNLDFYIDYSASNKE